MMVIKILEFSLQQLTMYVRAAHKKTAKSDMECIKSKRILTTCSSRTFTFREFNKMMTKWVQK